MDRGIEQDTAELHESTPNGGQDSTRLLAVLKALRAEVEADGRAIFDRWRTLVEREDFRDSALNLAHYLALRRHDLRPLQTDLMSWGLSSLGRAEARVLPNLDAVIATLSAVCGACDRDAARPDTSTFFEGERLLLRRTEELFGPSPGRRVRIMVTLPTEAATDYEFVRRVVARGANCVRINCAHDDAAAWEAMIAHTRRAEAEEGRSCRVMMDLGGPKIRTGRVVRPSDTNRFFAGDHIVLTRTDPGKKVVVGPDQPAQVACTAPEALDRLEVGHHVFVDDGKIRARVINPHYPLPGRQSAALLRISRTGPKGARLKPDKGLNFPETVLPLDPLTDKDRKDLDFVVRHADIVGYSFVQSGADIARLQAELDARTPAGREAPAVVAKIETPVAVANLPEMIVRAAGRRSFGVMIARGDLAVEMGYQRLAEMQEEILWLCEAARVPVIWATQVLENLVKRGMPSRGEMTDAAMAERAECVMLNKGPFIADAITILDDVLVRMEAHQVKKTPKMRALRAWQIG